MHKQCNQNTAQQGPYLGPHPSHSRLWSANSCEAAKSHCSWCHSQTFAEVALELLLWASPGRFLARLRVAGFNMIIVSEENIPKRFSIWKNQWKTPTKIKHWQNHRKCPKSSRILGLHLASPGIFAPDARCTDPWSLQEAASAGMESDRLSGKTFVQWWTPTSWMVYGHG